ncbi:J domain-containing protein [Pseudochryseolinea flava]|uniref:J domain-containing protein n=1 Tax=Pseudochryseolinea flava TaxID=2059302 RepID=A0A364XX96_9BACT|nr:DnaJ domain-containing protein [Pseudochryseolinea flava]RAV98390.1 hypothetical protein DQQ10_23980 [Pseudochryseolinea flava]
MKDYYAILGVREAASSAEIKRAYRLLAVQYHPDKNPSAEAESLFKEINEAYDVLSDVNKKFFYDQRRYKSLHEVLAEEPVKTHRDPRYRAKTATTNRTGKPRKPPEYLLMEKLNKYVLWINIAGAAIVVFFLFDYVIPYKTTQEAVYSIREVRNVRSRGIVYYMITTESDKKIKVYDLVPGIADGFTLDSSRIYGMPMAISTSRGEFKLAYMYSALIFVPLLLLLIASIGILIKKNITGAFNCGIVTTVLIIITLVLIY